MVILYLHNYTSHYLLILGKYLSYNIISVKGLDKCFKVR